MRFIASFLALLVGGLPVCATAAESRPSRPNIVLVFIDDMGWGDLSCFGNESVRTEHLDRLASEGLRFSQFYVNSPICSPSRVALTTGQYPHRWRITSFLSHRADNQRRGMAQWLDPAAPALARLLKGAGYATGHFGKWHMGGQRDVGEAPLISEYGFDESLTNFEGLGPRVLPLCDAHDGTPPRKHALGSDRLGRGPIVWQDRSRVTESFTAAAIDFIRRAASADRPFYVNLWPDDVHSPFFPPAARRGDGTKRALYYGVLETMDEQLGALFDVIRTNERLRDNTLILVCSDNGPEPGAGSAGPFRGVKTTLYEGGIRSPLIVWGPGLIPADKAGHHNETSVFSAMDLVPSLLALAGVEPSAKLTFDGENVLDVILGRSETSRAAPLFWRRPPDRKSWPPLGLPAQPDLAVRDGRWKLLCDYDGSGAELYDLAVDPGETTSRAAAEPVVVSRLTAAVLAWHRSLPPDNAAGDRRPNVLWITSEDNSPYLGCYGDELAHTPHLDRLATEGVRYRNAFANAPVCSTARTTLITGMYATSLGVQHHRSRVRIPERFQLYPISLRAAGYYCTNNSKTDYNVADAGQPWDESSNRAHYRNRRPGQPFFAVFNFTTSHESRVAPAAPRTLEASGALKRFRVPPEKIVLPPYHPDTPEIRRDWANYYDQVTAMDEQVGAVLAELEREGAADDTIVFYYSDHGGALPRGKRNIHDSGTRVPLIVRFPQKWAHLAPAAAGEWVDQPVSFVDLPATVFSLCGVPIPEHFQGRAFLGSGQPPPREHVFLYRGRMDERYDTVRAVRDRRYRYVRNYSPHRPWGQQYSYPFRVLPSMRSWFAACRAGECNPVQARYWEPKPPEELYDLDDDPFEIRNLAGDPQHAARLAELRAKLRSEMLATRDTGFIPEGMFARFARFARLAGGQTIYDYAQSAAYPLERIIDLADKAASRDARFLDDLIAATDDPHPVVRYWGAVGCLVLEDDARPARARLAALLDDDWADVRVAAAEALAQLGETEAALSTLAEVVRSEDLYESLAALNALDFLWQAGRVPLPRAQAMVRGLELREPAGRIPTWLLSDEAGAFREDR